MPSFLTTSFVSLLFVFHIFLCSTGGVDSINNASSTGSPTPRILTDRDLARYHEIISRHKKPRSRSLPSLQPGISHRRAALENTTTSTTHDAPSNNRGIRNNTRALTSTIKLPLYSVAADQRVGDYLTELRIGTPAKTFKLLMDTGSDLTWVRCRYKTRNADRQSRSHKTHHRQNRHHNNKRRRRIQSNVFKADKSSSFKMVACGSKQCTNELSFSISYCPNPSSSPCVYNYMYGGSTFSALGFFGEETSIFPLIKTNGKTAITKKSAVKMRQAIGCTVTSKGKGGNFMNAADGVLGMSCSIHSLGYMAATEYGGGKFSYCLVDHLSSSRVRGYLIFGHDRTGRRGMQYTTLGATEEGMYAWNVKGISVNGVMLDIPPQQWDLTRKSSGAILDTGMTLTFIAPPAYEKVMTAVTRPMSRWIPKSAMIDVKGYNYCFNSTASGFKESMVPRLAVHLLGGAKFEPQVKSYVIDIGVEGVKCFGILEGQLGKMSVFGNIMQQNYVWEYDLLTGKLGFGPSDCK